MRTCTPRRAEWLVSTAIVLTLAVLRSHPLPAQGATQGQWQTLSGEAPINPVHVAVMINGDVLLIAGSGNDPNETKFQAAVWSPLSQIFQTQTLEWDMFCNGMVTLPDGRVFVNGGNLKYDPFFGERRSAVFDPWTSAFTDVENMANGRWYPTVTTLGDGRIKTFSGLARLGFDGRALHDPLTSAVVILDF